jgi:RNA polymerase sigma-70 factor (ECF subfamily)
MPNALDAFTDQQLVQLALEDDQRAYDELVRRYRRQIFWTVFQMVGDWDLADSATHETFIRAFKALMRYKPELKFAAWLDRIARNTALSRVHQKKLATLGIEGSSIVDTDEAITYTALQVPSRDHGPLEQVLTGEQDSEFDRAMARLKPLHRELLLLAAEKVPHEEIARRMQLRVGTVNVYINRARDKLKKALKAERQA